MTHPGERDQQGPAASEDGMNQGMRVLSHLVAGVLLYGGLGWLGDHLLGTSFLLPLGIVLGAGLGIYTTIRRLSVAEGALPGSAGTGTRTTSRTTHGATEGER